LVTPKGQNIAFDRKFVDGDANKLGRLAQEWVDSGAKSACGTFQSLLGGKAEALYSI
jgi:hypothetical protein